MHSRLSSTGPVGMFMPIGCVFGQDAADFHCRAIPGFPSPGIGRNVFGVVAAFPQRAETKCLNRYPSPDRRRCALLHRPPLFCFKTNACLDRRRFASRGGPLARGFDAARRLALSEGVQHVLTQGLPPCGSHPDFSFFRFARPHFQVVETPCRSRPLSGPARGPAWRRWSMDPSARARLSARRAMSPIARATRASADPLTDRRARRPAHGPDICQATERPRGASVAFFVMTHRAPGRGAVAGQDKGDTACSRRS